MDTNQSVLRLTEEVATVEHLIQSLQEQLKNTQKISKDSCSLLLEVTISPTSERTLSGPKGQIRDQITPEKIELPAASCSLLEILTSQFRQFLKECSSSSATIKQRLATLTLKEWDVLMLLLQGLSCKEIATRLTVGVATVAKHRAHIFHKLEARNMMEIVRDLLGILDGDSAG